MVALAVLGLQDNPLQEADLELLEIVRREQYPFKLYYHERTFKEILDILDAARASLKRRHFTPALSRAYLQYAESRGGGFGLERQFHALNATGEIDSRHFSPASITLRSCFVRKASNAITSQGKS